jgi:hypothetical protein
MSRVKVQTDFIVHQLISALTAIKAQYLSFKTMRKIQCVKIPIHIVRKVSYFHA